jgi:hypothetical protein
MGGAEGAGVTGRAGGSAGLCSAGAVGLAPKSFFRRFRAESGISFDLEYGIALQQLRGPRDFLPPFFFRE